MIAALLLVSGGNAVAEEDNPISTIVVTATRLERVLNDIPTSASIVSGDAIQRAQAQLGLDEALASVPGLYLQNRFNFAQDLRISIRGFGARSSFGVRGIKIFVDGIPETLADGQSQVDGIDLSSVERVEILRGPASALYGNASGGVINILSEQGSSDPYVDVRIAAGDYGYQKYQVKTAGGEGRFDYLLSLSELRIDGYREQSRAENTQLNSKFRFRPDSKSLVSMTLSASDQPLSEDAGGVTLSDATANPRAARDRNVQFDAGEVLDQQKLGFTYQRQLSNGATFSARNYYLSRDFKGRLPFTGGGIVAFDRFFSGAGASYSRPLTIGSHQHRMIVGIDYDRQDDDRQRFNNDSGLQGDLALEQNERISNVGVFLQDEITLSERLALTLGLRYDNINFDVSDAFLSDGDDSGTRSISDVSPSLGFVYAATVDLTLFGSVATAFETPTSTEFANPNGGGGFNPGLDAQKSSSFELGLRGAFSERIRFEVVAFDIDIDDELIPFEIATNPGRDFFVNAGQSSRHGLEFAIDAEPVSNLRMSLSYTYSKFKFDEFLDDNGNDFAGNTTPGIPEHFAFAQISYENDSGFFAAIDARYSDDIVVNNANTATIDGATVVDLRLGIRKRFEAIQIEPFLGFNNVTDTDYTANARINAFGGRYYEPGPEGNLYAGLSFRYDIPR